MVKISKKDLTQFERSIRKWEKEILKDVRYLEKVKGLIEKGELVKAFNYANDLDTIIRDQIPEELYDKLSQAHYEYKNKYFSYSWWEKASKDKRAKMLAKEIGGISIREGYELAEAETPALLPNEIKDYFYK